MGMNKKYWTGIDDLHNTAEAQEALTSEFKRDQSVDSFLSSDKLKETNTGRRDFLKFMGFSVAAATLAACETPVVKSIPYVVKPEEITPGIANYYASTYYDGADYGNVLVKTREGRPIHIKGNEYFEKNPELGMGYSAMNARINASVLEIYDSERLTGPMTAGASVSWSDLDAKLVSSLASARQIRIVSGTVISPSTKRAVAEFSNKFAGKVKHIQYDTISYTGITKANQAAFGKAVVPAYDFSKAKTIVSIGADFLSSWITPNIFTAQYAQGRRPEGAWMSKHFQFETIMSLSGSNADVRVPIKPSQEGLVAAALYAEITGGSAVNVEGVESSLIKQAAAELRKHKGSSLVVCGNNDPMVQTIVNGINQSLDSYGTTIDIKNPTSFYQGSDEEMSALVGEMNSGAVDVLIVYGTNPAYSWYEADKFIQGLTKVKTSVSFNLFADETGSRCTYQAPDHHYLESWNDLSPVAGRVDLAQPTINPLYNTRNAQESLLVWAGNTNKYYDYVRQTHNAQYTAAMMNSDNHWHMAVHNGTFVGVHTAPVLVQTPAEGHTVMDGSHAAESHAAGAHTAGTHENPIASESPLAADLMAPIMVAGALNVNDAIGKVTAIKGGQWEATFYQKVTMGNGNHANNPILQETPDPITKVTWDNYVTMAPADVKAMGLNTYLAERDAASVVKITIDGKSVDLPVFPAPGQLAGTIGIALGYGRGQSNEKIGKAAYQTGVEGTHLMLDDVMRMPIGKNVYPMVSMSAGVPVYAAYDVSIVKTAEEYPLASTQLHSTVMGRESVVKETVLGTYLKEKTAKRGEASYNMAVTLPVHKDVNGDGKIDVNDREGIREFDLWRDHPVEGVGHRWGLTVDLTSCLGCGACITACHTENNVPVVGKDEVLRHRDMHWMRIDRYFSSDYETVEETKEKKELGSIAAYRDMEDPAANPKTVHMPMMCQHCNHAPCETVCPVAATVHSNEGLNNMAYNRCIGTRYCANNCPYKVRRFNWFNYVTNDKFSMFNPSQDESMRMVLNPDVTVRTRGVMEKCSMCQQRIQSGKLAAKKAGEPIVDGSLRTACAEACPTNAIVFGDLNDIHSWNTSRASDVRSYHALEEVGIQPNVYYMTKVRNINSGEEA
jgi:MoCo/4Fe-4S cofactor protein with predicted Tat translocation signal